MPRTPSAGGLGVLVRRVGSAIDHRVVDGADAARLLERPQQHCSDPGSLGMPSDPA